jgi:hypothetical protein
VEVEVLVLVVVEVLLVVVGVDVAHSSASEASRASWCACENEMHKYTSRRRVKRKFSMVGSANAGWSTPWRGSYLSYSLQ